MIIRENLEMNQAQANYENPSKIVYESYAWLSKVLYDKNHSARHQ